MIFGKKKSPEDIIKEQIEVISKDEDKLRLINLYLDINKTSPNIGYTVLTSFHHLSSVAHKTLTNGFYQFIPEVKIPFYPGDILLFSHEENYVKGDILQYSSIDDGKVSFMYLSFEYLKDNGELAVKTIRTFPEEDDKIYAVTRFSILGRLVYKFEFGSQEWVRFLKTGRVELTKILNEITESMELIESKPEIENKYNELYLAELNRRKSIVIGKL